MRMLIFLMLVGFIAAILFPQFYSAFLANPGLNGLIRAAALELAPYRITVNGVEPGLILTPGTEVAIAEDKRRLWAQYVPLKRWGEPADALEGAL